MAKHKRIVIIGPKPPPYMGPTLATEIILGSRLRDDFDLIHLDTSDHRELSTLSAVDFTNVFLAVSSYVRLVWLIVTRWPAVVYIPISQTTLGYCRDAPYIFISKFFRRRVVCHLRGGNLRNWLKSASSITRGFFRATHRLVDTQIVLGDNLRQLFADIMPAERIYVVPNGKDINFSGCEIACREATTTILFLANLRRAKGILDALAAIQLLHQRCEDFRFVFAGGWTEGDVAEEAKNFLAANPHLPISYLGVLTGKEKLAALQAADVFFFPTCSTEGHPWVIVEALAAGLPIVSTDQGAIVESVIHQENGFIVDTHDIEQMVEHLYRLISDSGLRYEMGQKSREHYLDCFTEAQMIRAFAQALKGTQDRSCETSPVDLPHETLVG